MDTARRFSAALEGFVPGQQPMEDYYEAAWALRSTVIDGWIAAGETSLVRLLSRFQAHERRYRVLTEVKDGKMTGWQEWSEVSDDWEWRGLNKLEKGCPGVLRGREVEMSPYVTFDLAQMLGDFTDGVDTIVELGSGYGLRLFELYHAGAPAQARYVGAEISPSGRALAERLAALEPGLQFDSRAFDLNNPDWSFLAGSRKALIFSSWSLMYPRYLPDDFFVRLSSWPGAATLVFCEPLGFQWGVSDSLSAGQVDAANSGALNLNLAALAADAVAAGLIEPLLVGKDIYARTVDDAFDLMSVLVYAKAES